MIIYYIKNILLFQCSINEFIFKAYQSSIYAYLLMVLLLVGILILILNDAVIEKCSLS